MTALTNGHYVVRSPNWNSSRGTVTWRSGTAGVTGVVSVSNSLVGSTVSDLVGIGGVTALSNGNYSVSNSPVGSTVSDLVGIGGVTALSNGNYVVTSYYWDNGVALNAGAVTWGNGTTGIAGTVSASNSLVGSTANDQIGNGPMTALSNGNFVVDSLNWDNGSVADAGAVTWGNGANGTDLTGLLGGAVSTANSVLGIGLNALVEDTVNATYLIRRSTSGGAVYVGLATSLPNGVTFASNNSSTSNMSPTFLAPARPPRCRPVTTSPYPTP